VLGIDEDGREVLTFIPGHEGRHVRQGDATLTGVGRLVRRFHDAVEGFTAPPGVKVREPCAPAAICGKTVMCHGDLAPYNTIYAGARPQAFIDWDLARPDPPAWDLAHAVWSFVPLYTDEDCARIGLPIRPRGARLRLLCDGYGLEQRESFLDVVRAHLETLSSPFARRSIPFLDAEREDWTRHLTR
jgi:thiamine kinase-like enzyme